MTRFVDKVVLITGASRGIGAATALAFAAEGARVAINYRSHKEGAVATSEAITGVGGTARIFQADIADEKAVAGLARAVEDELGPIDILVNNAAFIDRAGFLDVDLAAFDTCWNANVRGVYQLSQIIARSMATRGGGAIVHISSILAQLACANRTAYIASKGAIEGLTRAMAVDLAPHGIRVNAVAPGLIATEALLTGMPDEDLQASVQSFIPERRFGRPDEITAAVLFAASPEASYINGTIMGVDGGLGAVEAGPP